MPRFAANLFMLWPELDVYDRFGAAAAAGFTRVETLFVHTLDVARVKARLVEYGLELVLFDPYPGDWDAGERGLLGLPGREAEFLDAVLGGIRHAELLGTRRLNVLAGIRPAHVSPAAAFDTAVTNLRAAAPRAEAAGVSLLIENLNPIDFPGYLADSAERAAALVSAVAHPSVRLQLDQYHVGMTGGDAPAAARQYAALLGHVQIADVPGRHEPGTGTQPIAAFLSALDESGYEGQVGLEYRPATTTQAALEWLPRAARS